MTNPNYTAIAVLMDRSGSMASMRVEAENAINSYIEDQKKEPGECTIRLADFDHDYRDVYRSTDIQKVSGYTLHPRGTTALNDGIGRLVTDFGRELSELPEEKRPGHVIVVIVTDGFENASREFAHSQVAEMIKHQQEKYGWDFVFLAAGQDAIATANAYNIDAGSALTFDPNAVSYAGASLSAYTSTTRSGGSYHFTDADRKAAAGQS